MRPQFALLVPLALALAACSGIPPVDVATISQAPASPDRFAAAQRAVSICAKLPDVTAMFNAFEQLGHQRQRLELTTADGKSYISETINSQGSDLKIIASSSGCTIGLESMTPDQSYRLALPWVRQYGLVTNETLGQGLSPHAVQAWRAPDFPSIRILAAAYKTWPVDAGLNVSTAGAAVRLQYKHQ